MQDADATGPREKYPCIPLRNKILRSLLFNHQNYYQNEKRKLSVGDSHDFVLYLTTVHPKAAEQFIICAIWVHSGLYTLFNPSTIIATAYFLHLTKEEEQIVKCERIRGENEEK